MSEENNAACSTCGSPESTFEHRPRTHKNRIAIFSGLSLLAGLALQYSNYDIVWIYVAFLSSALSAGRFIIPKGIRGLLRLRLDQHFLMTAASIGAMLIGAPAEGAAVMFLFYISVLLEERAEDKVRDEIHSLVEIEPPAVIVRIDGVETCISPTDVKKGDILIIRPGAKIGLDGVITTGATTINQAPITGESLPVPKSVGDSVYAGTINQEGYIEVEVTDESTDTVLSKIIDLVEESRKNKAPTERLISRFSRIYTPIIVVASTMIAILSLAQGATLTDSVYHALTLLVISCPCAFAISIPVSMVSAITGSARNGVLVKGGVHIEQLSKTEIVAFDKTGTLTEGVLSVKDVCLHNNHTKDEILTIAASLETMSEHPIARALVASTTAEGLDLKQASEFSAVPGRGIIGQIGDTEYLVGNRGLLSDRGIPVDLENHSCGIGTMVYVADESEHFGTIILSDTVRRGTREAIEQLKQMGIRTIMLTGDSENVASEVSYSLGIGEYRAELLPAEKVTVVEELKKEGVTVMIGDGINDTPALTSADVGIAMGAMSSDAALEIADIALMKEDLTRIPQLITKAKKTMRVVRQNVATSLSVKTITAILATLGLMTLWMAIGIGDMGLTFVVIANALRLAKKQ